MSARASLSSSSGRAAAGGRPQPLRLLILGGTQFIGIHLTEVALQRGHTVSLFNRGGTNPQLFPDVEKLKGDRDGQLDALKGRQWDAVIDASAYIPRHVRLTAELLAPNVHRYLYVSTVSVYASFQTPNNERSPMGTLSDETVENVDAVTYGPLKGLGEKPVHALYGDRASIVRPGYIVGPHDYTDRFTHWPARAALGGEMIGPGTPLDPMQFIDVRDFARFVIHLLETDMPGTFNIVSPPGAYSIGKVIDTSVEVAKSLVNPSSPSKPVWIPADFLERQETLKLGSDFPLWHPPHGKMTAFPLCDTTLATQAGLKITSLETTVRDMLEWHLSRPAAERAKPRAGISPERELEVLAAWRTA